jgi:hypothetical protein
MTTTYTIYYMNEPVGSPPVTSNSLSIGLENDEGKYYAYHMEKRIQEIEATHPSGEINSFQIVATPPAGETADIQSVDLSMSGGLTKAHCHWTVAPGNLTLSFKPVTVGSAIWEFGTSSSPPTKLKVIIKRQN